MIIPYTEIPDAASGSNRPLLDLLVADIDDALFPCLVDSGAQNTLLPAWMARAAGISLKGHERRALAVAASPTRASFVETSLTAGEHTWEAEVGFCDPWPYAWGILGHSGFFRYFTVTFRSCDFEFEVEPVVA